MKSESHTAKTRERKKTLNDKVVHVCACLIITISHRRIWFSHFSCLCYIALYCILICIFIAPNQNKIRTNKNGKRRTINKLLIIKYGERWHTWSRVRPPLLLLPPLEHSAGVFSGIVSHFLYVHFVCRCEIMFLLNQNYSKTIVNPLTSCHSIPSWLICSVVIWDSSDILCSKREHQHIICKLILASSVKLICAQRSAKHSIVLE